MLKKSNLFRYGTFFVLLGVLDFLVFQTVPEELNDRHRQLLTDISSHRGYGTHYVKIMVGSPPQMLRLAVATGSDYTSFPCQGCYTCDEPHFQYTAGTEHQCPTDCLYPDSICQDGHGGCHLTVTHAASTKDDLSGEGYKGFEVTDYAFVDTTAEIVNYHPDIAKKEGFPLHFICQEEILGNVALSDGFLGMSTSPLSFVNQLHKANKIGERIFSLCFRRWDDYEPIGESAGHMTLGHVDRDALDSPLVWAANKASRDSLSGYAVHIRGISFGIGGKPDVLKSAATDMMSIMPMQMPQGDRAVDYSMVNGTSGHVLIQTNQPTSYLDSSLEDAFTSTFRTMTGLEYNTPHFKMTPSEYAKLPTLFIQIEAHQSTQNNNIIGQHIPGLAGNKIDVTHPFDVLLAVPPEHYIIYIEGLAFPTLYFGEQSRIASNLLQHHEIVFDLDNDRIGFAERRHCSPGMSMMTPLMPAPRVVPSGPAARSDGRERPVEGFVEGETTTDGIVLVPEDRDFVVVDSDLNSATQSDGDTPNTPGGRTADGPEVVGTSSASSGDGNGISGELDDAERDSAGSLGGDAGSNFTNGLNGELDDGGASGGGKSKGRNSDGQQVGQGSGGGISDHFQPGVFSGGAGEHPLVEQQNGLPHAQGNSQALRIGPGAVDSAQALGDVTPKANDSNRQFNGYFNLLGFVLFFLGFCVTLIFTEDSNALYAYVTNNRDAPATATKARKGGRSFYNTVGSEKRLTRKKSNKMRRNQQPSKEGWISSGDSATASGSSRMTKLLDDYTYMGESYYDGDDRTYYTRDDRTEYTRGDDRSYYTETPYYDNGGDRSYEEESSGDYYQYEAKMSGSASRRDPMQSQRPYYDFSQRSSRSIYSQRSYRSMQSDMDESGYDPAYDKPQKPHFADYDQSAVFNQSMASFSSEDDEYLPKKPKTAAFQQSMSSIVSEEEDYYPKKPTDIRKFIKPVNSDDRSVFTSSTGSYSAFSKGLSSQDSKTSRSGLDRGASSRSALSGDGTYNTYDQYDTASRGGGTYVSEEGLAPRYGLQRGPSTRSEITGDGTYYTYSQYDDYDSRNDSFVSREDSRRPRYGLERGASARSGVAGDSTYYTFDQYDDSRANFNDSYSSFGTFASARDHGQPRRGSSGTSTREDTRAESQFSSQGPRMMASFRSLDASTLGGRSLDASTLGDATADSRFASQDPSMMASVRSFESSTRDPTLDVTRAESQYSSQAPGMNAFMGSESSTRDGTLEDTTGSVFGDQGPTLPPPPQPAPRVPISHPEPDDYSDVESFYVDEVSVAKYKGVQK